MAYLIGQLLVPLAIAAVFGGGLAGWSWHCIRNRDKRAARDAERERLRNELLTYVGYTAPVDTGIHLGVAEHDALQIRVDAANDQITALKRDLAAREDACNEHTSRIAQLEMALASAQAALPDEGADADRVAALETALREAEARAADVDRRAALLEADLDAATAPAQPGVDVTAMRWRIQELESQVARHDADAGIARIAAPVEATAARPDLDDALNRERWQSRYLNARVKYLESLANAPATQSAPQPLAAVAAPLDEEADNRRRWRQRYLEARVAWLEGRARDHAAARDGFVGEIAARDERLRALEAQTGAPLAAEGALAALQQRAAELEGALAAARSETAHAARRVAELEAGRAVELEQRPEPQSSASGSDPEVGRLRWQSRYLDSRVRYLEQSIATTPPPVAPQQKVTPRDDSFAPLAPVGAEVRPAGLPAARDGAPDDLRMIAGINPRIESTLNSLGVYHFDQIAAWTPANIDWLERYLAFKGRIGREDWVAQARALAAGEEAAGKRRYLEGEPV